MSPRRTFAVLFALLATAAAVVFFAISIDPDVYAPGATAINRALERHDVRIENRHVPGRVQRNLNPRRILRKTYSVVAFSIVGFFAAPLIARKRRVPIDALLIAGFSTIIEIAQKVVGSPESLLSNAFDIGCGALGGLIGATLFETLLRVRRRAT